MAGTYRVHLNNISSDPSVYSYLRNRNSSSLYDGYLSQVWWSDISSYSQGKWGVGEYGAGTRPSDLYPDNRAVWFTNISGSNISTLLSDRFVISYKTIVGTPDNGLTYILRKGVVQYGSGYYLNFVLTVVSTSNGIVRQYTNSITSASGETGNSLTQESGDLSTLVSAFCLSGKNYSYVRISQPSPGNITIYPSSGTNYTPTVTLPNTYTWVNESFTWIDMADLPDPSIPDDPPDSGGEDPYAQGGFSSTGGGQGSFSIVSDNVDFPSSPSLGAVTSDFVSLFNPTLAQIKNLADYMWNGVFDVNNFKKLFADPMDCILGLSIVPVAVPSGAAKSICIGNIISPVSANIASSQYVWLDCGTVHINEYWGSCLDYAPYTKIELYLPFVGTVSLDTDTVMGKDVHIKYQVDILSGTFMCYVKCGGSVLYSFSGVCSTPIPVTSNSWSELYKAIMQAAATAIGAGVGASAATSAVAGAVSGSASAKELESKVEGAVKEYSNAGRDMGVATAGVVMSAKPSIQKSGNMAGSAGMMGVMTPFLIITMPRQCLPQNQNKHTGYPSYVYEQLGNLTGFTQIQSINFENFSGTAAEKSEITQLLCEGVLL